MLERASYPHIFAKYLSKLYWISLIPYTLYTVYGIDLQFIQELESVIGDRDGLAGFLSFGWLTCCFIGYLVQAKVETISHARRSEFIRLLPWGVYVCAISLGGLSFDQPLVAALKLLVVLVLTFVVVKLTVHVWIICLASFFHHRVSDSSPKHPMKWLCFHFLMLLPYAITGGLYYYFFNHSYSREIVGGTLLMVSAESISWVLFLVILSGNSPRGVGHAVYELHRTILSIYYMSRLQCLVPTGLLQKKADQVAGVDDDRIRFVSLDDVQIKFDNSELDGDFCGTITCAGGPIRVRVEDYYDNVVMKEYVFEANEIPIYKKDMEEGERRGIKEVPTWATSRALFHQFRKEQMEELSKRSMKKADDPEFYKMWFDDVVKNKPDHIEEAEFVVQEAAYEFACEYFTLHPELKNKRFGDAEYTPVILAAAENKRGLLEHLLKMGADPDSRAILGNAAIHFSSRYGYLDIVELLIAYKADVNLPGDSGDTALHLAIKGSHEKVIEILSKHNASWTVVNDKGESPVMCAQDQGKGDWIRSYKV